MFPMNTSDDEINVVDQYQQQNLSDSSSIATPTQSGGDGLDGGGLSPIYDDDIESGDGGEIISSRQHGEEYEIVSASGHFRHSSEFSGNISATPSVSIDRSEPRARSKGNGKTPNCILLKVLLLI
ncbi:hypothetical protein V6N13_001251 [Hibiscus sabdariffa]